MGKRIDLSGQTINGVRVVDFAYVGSGKAKKAFWNCVCSCGKPFVVDGYKLRVGHTRSCGCLRQKTCGDNRRIHGESTRKRTRLYEIWIGINKRCSPHAKGRLRRDYYGRGIKVCDEWKNSYVEFRTWAQNNGYNDDLSIDRIDVNGNYEPSNCRWATNTEQQRNKRNNHLLTYKEQTKPMAVWCEELGLDYRKIERRINGSKWSVERAFET